MRNCGESAAVAKLAIPNRFPLERPVLVHAISLCIVSGVV